MRRALRFALPLILLTGLVLADLVPAPPADAALPKASCFRQFRDCRITCVEVYAPDEIGDIWINNPEAGMCFLDCDTDLVNCLLDKVLGD